MREARRTMGQGVWTGKGWQSSCSPVSLHCSNISPCELQITHVEEKVTRTLDSLREEEEEEESKEEEEVEEESRCIAIGGSLKLARQRVSAQDSVASAKE